MQEIFVIYVIHSEHYIQKTAISKIYKSLQFQTILLPHQNHVTEKRT